MRRAWLLALLLAPAAAAAQLQATDGQILFPIELNTPTDNLINIAECQGGTIQLDAKILFTTGAITFSSYQLYAQTDVASDGNGALPATDAELFLLAEPCPTLPVDRLRVGPVGLTRTENIAGAFISDVDFATSVMVAQAGQTCTASSTIVLCMQALDGTTKVGTARVRLPVVIDKPGTPTLTSVTPGEEALNVSWDAPSPGQRETYEVTAVPVDPSLASTVVSGRASAENLRVGGLVNGVAYNVSVRAFSDADNPSDPSNSLQGTPQPVDDFFETYKAFGGRETGGCGNGGVGLLALAGAAALLALRRRS
jgi:hypothetical protein